MSDIGMIRVAAASPKVRLANPKYNANEILKLIDEACEKKVGLLVFPSLSLTGASCGDLFFQDNLYKSQLDGLKQVISATKNLDLSLVLGFYLKISGQLINSSALIQAGEIKGIVPSKLPSLGLDGKQRFSENFPALEEIQLFGLNIPFGLNSFYDHINEIEISIEENRGLANHQSHLIACPSISLELIGGGQNRKNSLEVRSYENINSYIYASLGPSDSSSGGVFSGHLLIVESGETLAEDRSLNFENKLIISEIDFNSIEFKKNLSRFNGIISGEKISLNPLPVITKDDDLYRNYSKTPFIPSDPARADENCKEAFDIQATALARRLAHTGSKKAVLGISGGLDSTMALLVTAQAMDILGKPHQDIIGVTMPGFGTTGQTYDNAIAMMKALDVEIREISIKEATLLHFKDIGHDPEIKNVVYENVQARERTQILMDIANMDDGIQVGTGDLSEAALGWSTYNGDHMSMYGVNAGIPKTFMRRALKWYADELVRKNHNTELASTLEKVLATPVSPELLPPDEKGKIAQMTEDTVGPYILHDFFIYHTIRRGSPPQTLLFIAAKTFKGQFDQDTIKKWLKTFYRRFFIHQFKRSCVPDSPRVGTVSLFSRSDFLMASDADSSLWVDSLL